MYEDDEEAPRLRPRPFMADEDDDFPEPPDFDYPPLNH